MKNSHHEIDYFAIHSLDFYLPQLQKGDGKLRGINNSPLPQSLRINNPPMFNHKGANGGCG